MFLATGAKEAFGQSCPAGSLSQTVSASYPTSTTFSATSWGPQSILVPQFNVANASLLSVIGQITGRATGTIQAKNTGLSNEDFTLNLQGTVTANGPLGSFTLVALPTVTQNYLGVVSGATVSFTGINGSDTVTTTPPITTGLTSFIGAGNVTVSVSASNTSSVSGSTGNFSRFSSVQAGADVQLTYCYAYPDLTIAKTHGGGSFTQGQTGATFTLTVSNVGAGDSVGTVTATDTLPAGLTATAISGTGWACVLGTLICTRSDVLAAAGVYPVITVTVNVSAGATSPQTNTANVSGGGETNLANDSATDSVTVTGVPDLTIAKTHGGGSFAQGQTGATFTLTVSNVGGAVTAGLVTVTDTLPAGLTATAISGTGWACVLGTLTCTRSDVLAAAGVYPVITVTVNVSAGATSPQINTANVSGGGETNLANDSATDSVTVTGLPDLTIAKTHGGGSFAQGQTGATFTLTVSNVGGAVTAGLVTVTDTLPAGLTATAISGTGWACVLGTLTCTRSDVLAAAGVYPVITVTVNVSSGATSPQTNTANVSGGGETNLANDSATDSVTVTGLPDLTIAKTHGGGSFAQGQTGATFTLTVSNVGGAVTAGLVTVTDTLPAGLTATAISGTGWACVLGTLTCTRSDVLAAAGVYPVITVTVNVSSGATSPQTNTANVSGGGETNLANDSATDAVTVTVTSVPDLTITKTHGGGSFTQGQTGAAFTLTVSNVGTASTAGLVTVTDTLPAGLTATAISGTGWSCTLGTLTCTRSDALAPAGAYPAITVTVNVSVGATSPQTNTANVSGGGETNPANDSATDTVTVTGAPDLTISKTHGGGSFAQGQTGAAFTLTVTNVGGAISNGPVTVTDTLPAGLAATAISGTGWTCALTTLSCTRSSPVAHRRKLSGDHRDGECGAYGSRAADQYGKRERRRRDEPVE